MKTLNLTLRTILLILALASTATTAIAYDMKVNGIYYNINGDEATVTYMRQYSVWNSGNSYYYYENDCSGDIVIPETVTYDGKTYTVTAIGEYAFYNRYSSTALKSISIPNTVTSIGKSAFYYCYGLKSISFPNSLTSIGNNAFSSTGLTYAKISNSVLSIGDYAFANCTDITSLTIGESVVSIGQNAFSVGSKLMSITCLSVVPPSVANSNGFNDYSINLYVPKESVELYRTTSGWNYFRNVFGFGNDSFSIPDETSFHGDTIMIPISMQNESSITAFQTDVYLPEGFELAKVNDEYQVSLSDRKGRDHVIMVNEATDGALRVLSYSPTLKAFKNNEGELFYISVKVPVGASGTFPIWLRNTILTSTDEEELYAIDALSNVSVTNIIMGDVNNDGIVTIADVVTTARYILNYNPDPFVFEAADMNGDSKITITDVVKIANLILDQDYDEPEYMRMMAPNMAGDHMSGEAKGNSVSINLDNEKEYTALQLDLTLPEGLTASDFELTERASNLSIIQKDRGNGKVRVVAYAPDLKAIKSNDGAILTFIVDGKTSGDILVDRIELVSTNGESVHLAGFNIPLSTPTALNEMTASKTIADVKYFNLAGQQMTEPATGVSLVVITYNDGTRTTSKIIK